MDTTLEKITFEQLVESFTPSLGLEKATELIKEASLKMTIGIKENYSSQEASKICEFIETEKKGFIKTIAGYLIARIILQSNDSQKINELILNLQSAKIKLEELAETLEEKVVTRTQDLEKTKSYLECIIDNLLDCVIVTDMDGTIRLINDPGLKFVGLTREEILGKNLQSLSCGKTMFNEVIKKGQVTNYEFTQQNNQGALFYMLFSGTIMHARDSSAVGVISIAKDITERKQAEERYRTILQTALDGFLIIEPQGNILDSNQSYCNMIGYDVTELLMMKLTDITLMEDTEIAKHIERIKVTGHDRFETRHKCKSGKILDLEISANFFKTNKEQIFVFLRDITARKQVERELSLAKTGLEEKVKQRTAELENTAEQLKRALQAKTEFLSSITHELRTPLNSINGFSEILHDEIFGPLNQKQKDYTNYILTSGKHLLALINDILNLSKMEAGKSELSISTFSLKEKLENTLILFNEQIINKNLTTGLDIQKDIGTIEADERKFEEIIYNLLSNAIKFTPENGKIGIKAHKISDYIIEIEIWDTGCGIVPENLPKLFTVFTHIETPLSKGIEGTGLGLAYTKKLVELQGGKIEIKSMGLGRGSTVIFTLPIKAKRGT